MSGSDAIKKHLEFLAQHIPGGWPAYVLENGRQFSSVEPTPEQLKYVEHELKHGQFKIKQCFYNAQKIAVFDYTGRFQYYEGYLNAGFFPIEHGWLVLDGEIVVDPTCRFRGDFAGFTKRKFLRDRAIGVFPEKWGYYGVKIDKDFIRKRWIKTGIAEPMLPYVLSEKAA